MSSYAEKWDRYVDVTARERKKAGKIEWAGDEWGAPPRWDLLFSQFVGPHIPADAGTVLEIGPGSGKYTLRILDTFPSAKVIACDVSKSFLQQLQVRCATYIKQERLCAEVIEFKRDALDSIAAKHGLTGTLDAIVSIDAMVHVNLREQSAYFASAARILKPGGKIIWTVADATTEIGLKKLIGDTGAYFENPQWAGLFEWVSPDITRKVLDYFGFDVTFVDCMNKRDLCFAATRR